MEIMNVVWQFEECTVADVLKELLRNRPVTRNTVQTMLSRLDEKGWLKHRDDSGTFRYSAIAPRESVQQRVLERVVDSVFDGSAAGVLAALLKDRSLSREEAGRIRQMIDRAEDRK
jgi:predicted transcriptional regulator